MSSNIQWTDKTWNVSTGCTKVSAGCKHCYAEVMAKRLENMGQARYVNGFAYTQQADILERPKQWKRPKKIFVNSMSDLFHEQADQAFLARVFSVMMETPQHTYQVLTKRPERMATIQMSPTTLA